jgi:hypothetical protein
VNERLLRFAKADSIRFVRALTGERINGIPQEVMARLRDDRLQAELAAHQRLVAPRPLVILEFPSAAGR